MQGESMARENFRQAVKNRVEGRTHPRRQPAYKNETVLRERRNRGTEYLQ